MLERLADAGRHRRGEEEGRRFFALIREYTVMGYYTSRIGMAALGYPGLRHYAESPGCPDPGDPLHKHRQPAGTRPAAFVAPHAPPGAQR
jgi:hypothetical protein